MHIPPRMEARERFAARVAAVAAAAFMLLPQNATAADSTTVSRAVAPMSLAQSIELLPVGVEDRTGYDRAKFKHWVDEDKDGCSTRAEVLLAESRVEPTVEAGCWKRANAFFSAHGITVERVLTDNGSCYRSRLFAQTLSAAGSPTNALAPIARRQTARSSA